ncbi:enolase C-terminal domain-like protein [Chryseobacterium sp. MFBS3-17]|uniref:enolase C-terminal domain-like protein n=1 Tax=Chryseobacterium sp. MFBS3-17 TaxID=2886689 RepID=UPI001D0E94FC|nr:enolase C-terminal domain-like protein [Chryseobacterium sp. MFBS3-17]MCC2590614.1 chloromuconate cycloisomerase [Chryseobacterium sp. MFBS3-17]
MELKFRIRTLQLRETFSIAYGSYHSRDVLSVELAHAGHSGYGECVEIDYYGIRLQDFVNSLHAIQASLENRSIVHPSGFYTFLLSQNLHPFLRSALDCAYWDLFGKLEHQSFARINGIINHQLPQSTFTISIAPPEKQLTAMKNSAWQKFKVKCNGYHPEQIELLLNSGYEIALDANASFTAQDCISLQHHPAAGQLLYVEQPMETGHYQILKKNCGIIWMADEDLQNEASLPALRPYYNAINIKLMKCGGLTPALDLIRKARALDFKIMLGCMTESSAGISAACTLAGLVDFADLDGANLIANDYAQGSFVENGHIHLSEMPGLGISLR